MDCTDIKAILSGLVDDEVDRETRHEAERHLAECPPCRTLVSQAEGLNRLIALDAQSMIPARVSEDFEAAVLSRTVYPQTYKFRARRRLWTNSVGWLAAAACLTLASLIWLEQQQSRNRIAAGGGQVTVPGDSGVIAVVYPSGANLQSRTFDGDQPIKAMQESTVSPDDADTLYAASVLLDMLNGGDATTFAEVERVRRIAEYDDMLDRLATVRQRLPQRDRPMVLAAEGILTRAVLGPLSQDDLRQMHETVARLDLPREIDEMSRRHQIDSSL